jgi:hypothetical protein
MGGMLFSAGLLIIGVIGPGCSSTQSRNKEAVASEPVFADLPASTSALGNPEVEFEKMRPGYVIAISFTNKVFIAAGKTVREVEKEVFDHYRPNHYPVTVTDPAPILVFGEVKVPGKRPFSGAMTVLKVIESAGGFTQRANPRHVKLVRSDGRQYVVNCIKARTDARMDLQVYADHRIVVPSGRPSW